MQWSRVKSILIVILLVANGFLAFNIAGKYVSRYYRETETAHNMTVILTARGIEPGRALTLPEAHSLPVLQIDRSRPDEDTFSTGLLGEDAERTETPDGAVTYTGAAGSLTWSGGGSVAGAVTPVGYKRPSGARAMEEAVQKLLSDAGVTNSVELAADETASMVTAGFQTAGVPVFNRKLTFGFSDTRVTLTGWWTFGVPYTTRSGVYAACEASDAVFTLISRETVGRIDRLEEGFLLTENGSGRVQMTPGWRIETDIGCFFVDSLKKSSMAIENY